MGDILIVSALVRSIEFSANDLNSDGKLNVLTNVQLVNIILYGSLGL